MCNQNFRTFLFSSRNPGFWAQTEKINENFTFYTKIQPQSREGYQVHLRIYRHKNDQNWQKSDFLRWTIIYLFVVDSDLTKKYVEDEQNLIFFTF